MRPRLPFTRLRRTAAPALLVLACALVAASAAALPTHANPAGTFHYELAACTGVGINNSAPVVDEDPQAVLSRPADGRLNGYNFTLTVKGFADSPCVPALPHAGFADYLAPAGESVVIVSWDLQIYGFASDVYAPDIDFVVGGTHVVAYGQSTPGRSTVELDVPSGATVALSASEVGVTQELSLQSGNRLAPVLVALYRSDKGPSLTESIAKSAALQVLDRAIGLKEADTLRLDSVELTYFSPVNPRVRPGNAGGAFLLVRLSEIQPQGGQVDWLRAMPPDRMRLVLPGGAVIEPDPASTPASQVWNLLDGTYFFDVPAGFTNGTLEIAPGINPAYDTTSTGVTKAEDDVVGTASFPIDLPPVPNLATGLAAAPSTAPDDGSHGDPGGHAATPTATGAKQHGSGNVRTVVLIATSTVLVPVFLVFVVPVFVRRRQRKRGPYTVDAAGLRIDAPGPLPRQAVAAAAEVAVVQSAGAPTEEPLATAVGPAAPAPEEHTAASSEKPAVPPSRAVPSFRVLGEVEAADLELRTKRLVVVELLVFLACMKGRRFTPGEVMAELWPLGEDGSETVSRSSFQKYMTYARRAAGSVAFPTAMAGRLSIGQAVTTDWEAFQGLVAEAAAADSSEAAGLLATALGLVRGPAFSGVPKGRYGWAERGLITEIDVAVIAAAERLAELCLDAGEPHGAMDGIARAFRATKDPRVADDLLSLAGASGDLGTLERAWRDVEATIGADESRRLRRSYEAIRRRLVEEDELVG